MILLRRIRVSGGTVLTRWRMRLAIWLTLFDFARRDGRFWPSVVDLITFNGELALAKARGRTDIDHVVVFDSDRVP